MPASKEWNEFLAGWKRRQAETVVSDDFCGDCRKEIKFENKITGYADLDNNIKFDCETPICESCADKRRKHLIAEKECKNFC